MALLQIHGIDVSATQAHCIFMAGDTTLTAAPTTLPPSPGPAPSSGCAGLAPVVDVSFINDLTERSGQNHVVTHVGGYPSDIGPSGIHFDGNGDYLTIADFDYEVDGTFTISFWFTKERCTGQMSNGVYEYMYSDHQSVGFTMWTTSYLDIYLGCTQSGGGSVVRYWARDTSATEAMMDWPLSSAGNFDAVTRNWVHILLTVAPASMQTYEDGVLVPQAQYGFYGGMPQSANSAAPTPNQLSPPFHARAGSTNIFDFRSDIHIGGRADHDNQRRFLGHMALLQIHGIDVSATQAHCIFMAGDTTLPAGPVAGPPPPAPGCPAGEASVTIIVHTARYANEVTLQIDQGATFGRTPAFADNSVYEEDVCLTSGRHTLKFFDAYGDGWGGGWWELRDHANSTIMGGPQMGLVTRAGGEAEFTVAAGGTMSSIASDTMAVVIQAGRRYANEITWNIDGGQPYPSNSTPYLSGQQYRTDVTLPEGRHKLYFFDAYGDGWDGGWYQVMNATNHSVAGGPVAGLVTGSGGEAAFCVVCCDIPCGRSTDTTQAGGSVSIAVQISAGRFANEISWNIDNGQTFPGAGTTYTNNANHTPQVLTVTEGIHTINYFDSYGDGWGGGYWTIRDASGATVAGGPQDGVVTGSGGETRFCVGSGCAGFVAAAPVNVSVEIHSMWYANDISWNIDGEQAFGVAPNQYRDNSVHVEHLMLPAGNHSIFYIDGYGDGWGGGYWQVKDCTGATLAGGPVAGLVSGQGGETSFIVPSSAACAAATTPAPTPTPTPAPVPGPGPGPAPSPTPPSPGPAPGRG
jgi:hypothetical protein